MENWRGDVGRLAKFEALCLLLLLALSALLYFVPAAWVVLPSWLRSWAFALLLVLFFSMPLVMIGKWVIRGLKAVLTGKQKLSAGGL